MESSFLKDPSLEGNKKVFHQRKINLKLKENNNETNFECILRFITNSEEELNYLRIEITLENDLFFFVKSEFSKKDFSNYQKKKDLSCSFNEFPIEILNLLDKNTPENNDFLINLIKEEDFKYTLIFSQKLAIKIVNLFDIEFIGESEEFLKNQIQYRFDLTRSELQQALNQKSELLKMLKSKESYSPKTRTPRNQQGF